MATPVASVPLEFVSGPLSAAAPLHAVPGELVGEVVGEVVGDVVGDADGVGLGEWVGDGVGEGVADGFGVGVRRRSGENGPPSSC